MLRGGISLSPPHLMYVTHHKNGAKNEEKNLMRDYVSKNSLIDLPAEDYFGDDKNNLFKKIYISFF